LAGLNEEFPEDDPLLLDFDFACAYRLDLYERDARKQQAQMIAMEVSRLFGGEPEY
jgi:hypothetical protein